MTQKEELRKKFNDWTFENRVSIERHVHNTCGGRADDDIHNYDDGVFDFFYSDIEALEHIVEMVMDRKDVLPGNLRSAFEEKYNQLKTKSQS